jgi:hypothetical protein
MVTAAAGKFIPLEGLLGTVGAPATRMTALVQPTDGPWPAYAGRPSRPPPAVSLMRETHTVFTVKVEAAHIRTFTMRMI